MFSTWMRNEDKDCFVEMLFLISLSQPFRSKSNLIQGTSKGFHVKDPQLN